MYVTNVEQVWGNHLARRAMEWYPRSALGYLQHAWHYNMKDPPACHCCWSQCVEYFSSCQFLPSSQSSLSRSWTWMRAVKSKARLPGVKLSWEGQGSTAFSRLTPVHSQREAWTLLNWSCLLFLSCAPANSESTRSNVPLLSCQGALSLGLASLSPVTSQDQRRGGSRCCITSRAED